VSNGQAAALFGILTVFGTLAFFGLRHTWRKP
jgi:hypothetical protein